MTAPAKTVRHWRINLSLPPERGMNTSHWDLHPYHLAFCQPPDRWLLMFYLHHGSLGVGARAYPFSPGSMSVIPPGTRATHDRIGEGTETYWFEFELKGDGPDLVSIPVMTHLADGEQVHEALEAAIVASSRNRARMIATVWNLLWRVSQPASFYRMYEELYEAERYILERLNSDLRVEAAAAHIGVSSRTLLRMFREEHGVTVEDYVRGQRLELARRLLATTNKPIKAIAARVGVKSYQHLYKLIKEATGLSPNEYREHAVRTR